MLPLCSECLNRILLCSNCQDKLEDRVLSPLDIHLSRVFSRLGFKCGFISAIDACGEIIILSEKKDVGKIIGEGGSGLSALREELDAKVKVVGSGDLKELAGQLCAPAKIKSLSRVYGGENKHRIVLTDLDKLRIEPKALSMILTRSCGEKVEVTAE